MSEWREHHDGMHETSTSGVSPMIVATSAKPAGLLLHFETADVGEACCPVTPTLRAQATNVPFVARQDNDSQWVVERDPAQPITDGFSGRVSEHQNADGSWRLSAHIGFHLCLLDQGNRPETRQALYVATSPVGFDSAGPWRLRLDPRGQACDCANCRLPDELVIERKD